MSINNNDRAKDYMLEPQSNPPPYGPQTTQPVPIAMAPPSSNITNTTVVVAQPGATKSGAPRMWNSGICGCCQDCSSLLAVCFCPLCYAFYLSDQMGEFCLLPCWVPGFLIALRTKLRIQHNIEGSILNDCVMSYCCGACVMCQMARELDFVRGQQRQRQ